MATRLTDLERRASRRSAAAQSALSARLGTRRPAYPVPTGRAQSRSPRRGYAMGGGLEAKLIKAGAPPEEAARIAREIEAVPTQMSRPGAFGLSLPSVSELTGAGKTAALAALRFSPIGIMLDGVFALCDRFDIAIGIGLSGVAGVVEGAGVSGGVVFAPGRKIGFFGSLGLVMGVIAEAHGGATLTVVRGGLSSFNGTSFTIGGAIGEGYGLSGHLMLNTRGEPIGIIAEIGLTAGVPITAIGGIWETGSWTTTLSYRGATAAPGYAAANGHAGGLARSRSASPLIHDYSRARNATETSFDQLAGVPVHYDRLAAPNDYGSKGVQRSFNCTQRLKDQLDACMTDLFATWSRGTPTIILSAGTIGDGANAHGQGLAFDLDGFWWDDKRFMMNEYPSDKPFYIGINAHLLLYFSQVLSYYHAGHRDHFHVDFNFREGFRKDSQAQGFFVQSALRYIYGKDIGTSGPDGDGVDGKVGASTLTAITEALADAGIAATSLSDVAVWRQFLTDVRRRGFA